MASIDIQELLDELRNMVAGVGASDVPDKLNSSIRFAEDLGFDSLDRVDFLALVEKHYDIAIPDSEVSAIASVGDLIKIMGRELGAL